MTRRPHAMPIFAAALAVLLHTGGLAFAQSEATIRYETAERGSTLKVEGTSNIHDWDGTTDRIVGWIEVPGQWVDADGELRFEPALEADAASPALEVRIPVRSLEGNRSGLADNMHEAMKAEDHPHVIFTLNEVNAIEQNGENAAVWSVTGDLQVAGATQSVDLELTVRRQNGQGLRIEVRKDLKMTDFNIDPPTALLGMARAEDDVEVQATWIVQRQSPQPTLPAIDAPAAQREAMSQVVSAYEAARRGMIAPDPAAVRAALTDLDEVLETLRALEADDNQALDQWRQRVDRIASAMESVVGARSQIAARASFGVLSQAVGDALALVGHNHESNVVAYRYPGQRGIEGSLWLELSGDDAPRSPYTANANQGNGPRTIAIYPGSALMPSRAETRTDAQAGTGE